MELYAKWRKWRPSNLREEDGVLVASDISLEWLLPWWWENYIRHNSHPVAFVDFGMSLSMKEWCKKRGEYIPLPVADLFVAAKEEIDPQLVDQWETLYGNRFWPSRGAYFKKPLACLQSPFRRTIWIDLDCEIQGSIEKAFQCCENPSGLSHARELSGPLFNSGVIVYRRGSSLMEQWADASFRSNHRFATDQDILSHLIHLSQAQNVSVSELPPLYNWSRFRKENPEAAIVHWHGAIGKRVIYEKINKPELLKDRTGLY